MKKILFIVFSENEGEVSFIKKLASELRKRGGEVSIFFMSRGVKVIGEFRNFGGNLSLCSRNAEEFSVMQENNPHVKFASQYELSKMVEEADVIMPFV